MKKKELIKSLGFDALFLALIFTFAFVPSLGYINIGTLGFTTIHILVILGAALFGTKKGTLYGLFFGISSLLAALQYPGTLNYLCLNPFISIAPRVLFGFVSGLVFDLLRKVCKQKTFNALIVPSGIVLTLLHTTLYFIFLYIFGYKDFLGITSLMGLNGLLDLLGQYDGFMAFIITGMGLGCLVEQAAAGILVAAIYIPLNKFFKIGKVVNKNEIKVKKNHNFLYVTIITLLSLLSVILIALIA